MEPPPILFLHGVHARVVPTLLLKDGLLVTQDAARRVVRGDILARDGVIEAVGGDLGTDADEVIDAGGDLIMPGLVNAHTHAAMTLLRGLGDDLPLEEWLRTRIWPAEAKLTRADVEAGTDLALLEMVRAGTTAFNDMYFFADVTAQRAADAGMRAGVGAVFIDFDTPEMPQAAMASHARGFAKRWSGHELITPTLAPHAAYTCSDETLATIRQIREETGMRVHTHCSETRHEVQDVLASRGRRPWRVLADAGLTNDSVMAHCGWVTKEEVREMANAGAHAAHCPVSNLKLATGGVMPLEEMREAGVGLALGTDGAASNNGLDLFESAKFAALVQKQHRWDARAASAQTVLDMATRGGAAALKINAGVLEPGYRADFAVVSRAAPHMTPLHDPVSSLVYAARGSDVRATIVEGRVLYLDGAFRTLDARRVTARASQAADALRERALGALPSRE